jgi:hypothetical protein
MKAPLHLPGVLSISLFLLLCGFGLRISYAQPAPSHDISTVLPAEKLSGEVQLPSGVYTGDLKISTAVKLSARSLGDFVLKGRITIEGGPDVVLENIVIDGSRPGLSGSPTDLLEIHNAKNVQVRNCSLFAFDGPFDPANPPRPSICEEAFWNAGGIRISDSEEVVLDGVRVATEDTRLNVLRAKNITVKNCEFCAPTAIGSQYKLFIRSNNGYDGAPPDQFHRVSGLTLENNVFRSTSRNLFVLNVGQLSQWTSDHNTFWGGIVPAEDCGGDRWGSMLARTLPIWREMSGQDANSKFERIDYVIDPTTGFKRDPEGVLTGTPNISLPIPKDFPGGEISVGVFRKDGTPVRTLIAEHEAKGGDVLKLHWDGTDNLRHAVAPGRYLVRMIAPGLKVEQSWIANTYGTYDGHVQQEILGLTVGPDGTSFGICYWDESGGEIKKYNPDGTSHLLQQIDLHGWGHNGSSEITADDKYIYARMGQSGNDGGNYPQKNKNGLFQYPPKDSTWACIRRYTLAGQPVPFAKGYGVDGSLLLLDELPRKQATNAAFAGGGLAAAGGKLFLSDPKNNKVRAYDRDTLEELQSWDVPNPGRLALDGKGALWVINPISYAETGAEDDYRDGTSASASIQKIDLSTGTVTTLPLPGVGRASALAFDPSGRLLIADDGPDKQVKTFDVSGGTPQLIDTLGQKGGIYAGAPGEVAPDKFNGITGVGCDAAGNIYVSSTHSGGELRKFSPDKKLTWHVMGLAFVDGASADPQSPEDVFMKDEHFKLDYSTHPVSWKYEDYTRDLRKTDPFGSRDWASNLVRDIGGQRFMYGTQMFPQAGLAIYKFEGGLATMCGFIKMEGADAKVWRDANGDGQADPSECQDPKTVAITAPFVPQAGDHGSWNWFVDTHGDIWKAYNTAGILHLPCSGLDQQGNPIYDLKNAEALPMPLPFRELHSVEYIPETDALYLGGETEESKRNPRDGWGPTTRVIARYDAKTQLRWITPVDTFNCLALSVTNDLLFAVDSRSAQLQIFDNKTGMKLGTAAVGKSVGYASGWDDFPMCIRAISLKNGDSIVFVEEDWCANIVLYRVHQDIKKLSSVPFTLEATGNSDAK